MIEKLIVALIVLTAGVLTVRSFLKSIRSGKCPSCKNCAFDRHDPENHCGCGHGGCGHGGCGHGGCGHGDCGHGDCGHGGCGCRKD